MFVTAKKGLALDGTHPTLITAYGFGGISSTPYFEPTMHRVARARRHHRARQHPRRRRVRRGLAPRGARRPNRQIGFDDFIAAGEWLIANKLHLARAPRRDRHLGRRHAGRRRCSIQRPDLFGAIVPIAGVHDLLRFQLFGQGAGWQGDLGSPDDRGRVRGAARDLAAPQRPRRAPAIRRCSSSPRITTSASRRSTRTSYAAALQAAQAGPAPVRHARRDRVRPRRRLDALAGDRSEHRDLSFLAANLGLS